MNQILIKLFTFLIISIFHKYYVSTTLIDFNNDSRTYQMSLKIFHDDLEKEIGLQSLKIDYKQYEKANLLISNYLKSNLKIFHNSVEFDLDYLGFERKDDLIIYYIEIYNDNLKTFTIENKILFNSLRNQKNIILVRHNNFRKSFIQTKDNFQSTISIP